MRNPEQIEELKSALGIDSRDIDMDEINRILTLLSPSEEKVIRRRYGIPKPVEEEMTGEQKALKNRIHQIEQKALRKLKAMKSQKD